MLTGCWKPYQLFVTKPVVVNNNYGREGNIGTEKIV